MLNVSAVDRFFGRWLLLAEDYSIVSDFTRFYMLTILYEGPEHGYGILQKYKDRVGKKISPGTVYPFLQQLQLKGLISVESQMIGSKEKKLYSLTDEGRRYARAMFKRFYGIVSAAIEPSLDICPHCGCVVYKGGFREVVDGVERVFCCVHCAHAHILGQ
jgi:DNA-binding PadR family transcriptional regulator